ncbi:MAG: glycosyltransferase family 2 protein [Caldilineaceae bacterium]
MEHTVEDPLVYIIVPVYNQWQDTAEALASLLGLSYPNFKIVVVDNGSQDQTLTELACHFPTVTALALGENRGFAGAVNAGITFALAQHAERVLIINNDIWVDPALLTRLVAASQPANVGVVGPAIYYAEEPERLWFAGARRHPLLLETRESYRGRPTPADWDEPFAVDYLAGTAILVRRELIEAIGLLDERFFFTMKTWTSACAPNALAFNYIQCRLPVCGIKSHAQPGCNLRFNSIN